MKITIIPVQVFWTGMIFEFNLKNKVEMTTHACFVISINNVFYYVVE